MYFCFIIEAEYRNELMPIAVANQLREWGHKVDLLEPHMTITCLTKLARARYDAYVLKTVSDGPGLSLLEAVESVGIPTINYSRAIRQVRDKAIAITHALAHGLPIPQTYFLPHPGLLSQIPEEDYPLVVKPTNGSSCRDIHKIDTPRGIEELTIAETGHSFLLAQQYVENCGFDIKLYVAGNQVFAVAKRSPLHPDREVDKRLIPITLEWRELALRVGKVFGLDIYGLDIVETPHGPMIVDINDFPSFGYVPNATCLIASHLIEVAEHHAMHYLYNSPSDKVVVSALPISN